MQNSTITDLDTYSGTTIAPASSSANVPFIKEDPADSYSSGQTGLAGSEEDLWDKEKPLRRKRRVKGQKICGVCGDLAQSHNFGALTCETCKAFFRRNAFKKKELQSCVFNSSCVITKATRRFCAPCRLKKCYSIGMDPDLILDEDEKKARQSKRERNESTSVKKSKLVIKTENQDSAEETTFPQPPSSSSSSSSSTSASPSATTLKDTTSPQPASNSGNETSMSPFDYPNKGKWCRPRNALGVEFKHVAREDLPWDMQLYWPLTVEERAMLTKLTSSLQTVISFISPEDVERIKQFDTIGLEKAIFALEYSMRRYVQYARCIPEFQELTQADQIATLKASALQWYHVRLSAEFIPEKRSWVNVFGCASDTQLGEFFGDPHGIKEYGDFCQSVKYVVKNDTTLYALIHVLLLFDPRDSNVENRIQVNSIRDKYIVLLKHHLESQFSFLHADRYLTEVMSQMLDIHQLCQSSLIFFKHFSSHFRPLIAEVFSS